MDVRVSSGLQGREAARYRDLAAAVELHTKRGHRTKDCWSSGGEQGKDVDDTSSMVACRSARWASELQKIYLFYYHKTFILQM